jgi:general secretion pathway protein D
VIITSDERTNKIFILSRASNFKFFENLISELDAKVEPDVVTKVIPLQYANAEEAAALMNAIIGSGSGVSFSRTRTTPGGNRGTSGSNVPPPPVPVSQPLGTTTEISGFLQFAQGVRILPDPRTNSLLIMATREDMARIEQMVRDVDTAVAQVLVEVVIAEVKLDRDMQVSVEAFKRAFDVGSTTMAGGTKTKSPNLPVDATGIVTNVNAGLLSSGLTWFTVFRNLDLSTVVHMLATSSDFKVLSTPIIQTLHNQEGTILVGESRPVITSTVSDISGAVVNNQAGTAVRSNVEYKDIAIELKVTPRINPDGFVTMDIEQKVNDVAGEISINGTTVPIITKREAKSSVSVKDESTIVLGGLIREGKVQSDTKVPFFGDLPFFGTAFRGRNTTKARTELIVFIRPTVLRTQEAETLEVKKRVQMFKTGMADVVRERFKTEVDQIPSTNAIPAAPATAPSDASRQAAKMKALQDAAGNP